MTAAHSDLVNCFCRSAESTAAIVRSGLPHSAICPSASTTDATSFVACGGWSVQWTVVSRDTLRR